KPVTGARLRGATLLLEKWNCSVASPGPGWTWLDVERSAQPVTSESFVCWQQSTDMRLIFTVAEGGGVKASDAFANEFLDGVRRSMQKRQGTLTDVHRSPSDIPLRGSYQITGTFHPPDGDAPRWRCYLAAAGPSYVFQSYSAAVSEPVEFRQLVSSFRLLRQPTPTPELSRETLQSVAACTELAGGLFLVLLCYGIGLLINRSKGRPVVNGAAIGLVLVFLVFLALSVFVASQPGFSKLDAEKQGEAIGRVFGAFFIPLIVGAVLAWRFQRKKKIEATKTPGTP